MAQLDETMREEGRRLFDAQHDLRRPARLCRPLQGLLSTRTQLLFFLFDLAI